MGVLKSVVSILYPTLFYILYFILHELFLLGGISSSSIRTLILGGSGEWELFRRNVAVGDGEVARRRSWAALEDLSHGKDSCKAGRQRR